MSSVFCRPVSNLDVLLAQEFGPLFGRRVPCKIGTETWQLTLAASQTASRNSGVCVKCAVDGEPARVCVSSTLLDVCASAINPALSSAGLKQSLNGLIIEAALTEPLDALEQALGAKVEVQSADLQPSADWQAPQIVFTLEGGVGGPHEIQLNVPVTLARRIMALWSGRVAGDAKLDPTIEVAVRTGSVTLERTEIERFAADDIVVFDQSPLDTGQLAVLFQERLFTLASLKDRTLTLDEPVRPLTGAEITRLVRPATLDPSTVTLVADLFRQRLTVSDFANSNMREVRLPRALEDGVDLYSAGTIVASGKIIRAGNAYGLRLTKVVADG